MLNQNQETKECFLITTKVKTSIAMADALSPSRSDDGEPEHREGHEDHVCQHHMDGELVANNKTLRKLKK